jgi:hypothetical protein
MLRLLQNSEKDLLRRANGPLTNIYNLILHLSPDTVPLTNKVFPLVLLAMGFFISKEI